MSQLRRLRTDTFDDFYTFISKGNASIVDGLSRVNFYVNLIRKAMSKIKEGIPIHRHFSNTDANSCPIYSYYRVCKAKAPSEPLWTAGRHALQHF